MLTIRREQMEVFGAQAEARFQTRAVNYFRRRESQQLAGISLEELPDRISSGIGRANDCGLQDELSIVTFLEYVLEVSPRFHEHPRVREILADSAHGIHLLGALLTDEEWAEASQV